MLDDPLGNDITGVSLVEQTTTVGGTTLNAGTFILGKSGDKKIYHYTADEVGDGTTSGTLSTLVDGADIDFGKNISGIELILRFPEA